MQLLFFALSLIFYYVLHSILANTKIKAFLMERFIPQQYYRLMFNVISVGLLIPIFYLYKGIPTSLIFEFMVLENIGLGIAVIGILLLILALGQYNLAEFSGTQQLKQSTLLMPESLKTTGFNAYVRHPLYFCGLLILWGGFLSSPTYLFLVISVVSTAYLYFGTKLEEEKLIADFGEEYLNYQKRVGMLIPFLVK
jgi:Putative protein-S-isoprenylcysteine methyltransferase